MKKQKTEAKKSLEQRKERRREDERKQGNAAAHPLAAAAADLALLRAAVLVPAQVLQADPARLVPAAPALLAPDPLRLPAPRVLRAPAADATITVAAPALSLKHKRPEMTRNAGKEAQHPNQLKFTWGDSPGMSPRNISRKSFLLMGQSKESTCQWTDSTRTCTGAVLMWSLRPPRRPRRHSNTWTEVRLMDRKSPLVLCCLSESALHPVDHLHPAECPRHHLCGVAAHRA